MLLFKLTEALLNSCLIKNCENKVTVNINTLTYRVLEALTIVSLENNKLL